MSTIPFIEARFFDPAEGRIELETHFVRHLRKLRCRRIPQNLLAPPDEVEALGKILDANLMGIIRFRDDDEARVKRRVKRLMECRKVASGLEHLTRDDRGRLEVLKDGARLISIRNQHHADEPTAALHEDMSWMAPATEVVWHAARRSWREGAPGLRMPPLLLDGPPGIGKSHWARQLGKLLTTPTTVIEATSENASFGIVGSQRGWGGSYPGRLIETVLQSCIANRVMVVDEIEKAGRATSTSWQKDDDDEHRYPDPLYRHCPLVAQLRARHVVTERHREVQAQLCRHLHVDRTGQNTAEPVRFTAGLESRGIILIEPAGGGKTTAIRNALQEFPALGTHPDTGAPRVLQMQVESPATLRSILRALLREMGLTRVSSRTSAWELLDLVKNRIAATGATTIWLDEAQDLFLSRSTREIDDMLKMIKGLTQGPNSVVVILSGTERLIEIAGYDPQVNRRFTKIIPGELQIGADNAGLTEVICDYCAAAGLTFDGSGPVVSRLIYDSRHRFGRAVETTINAIERALFEGDTILGRQHFAEAWGMQEMCAWDRNVFVSPDWHRFEVDAQAVEFDASRTARQRRALLQG